MKKIIFTLCLCFISITLSSQITETVSIPDNSIKIRTIGNYSKVEYGNNIYTDRIGYPSIPSVIKSYAIPIDAYDVRLGSSIAAKSYFPGQYVLYPVHPPKTDYLSDWAKAVIPDPTIYQSQEQYPKINAEILSDERVMGGRIIKVAYYPLIYIPAKRQLFKQTISVSLTYNTSSSCYFSTPNISENRKQTALKFLRSLVENPEVLLQEPTNKMRVNSIPESKDLLFNEIIPDYIIITTNELKESFQKLANWKTQKGVPTVIRTIEEINQEYFGADLIDKIAFYIDDIGKRWNNNALYILLGGDAEIVPTRKVKSVSSSCTELVATDAAYTDRATQYHADSKIFRSKNTERSAFLGRIPVKTIEQADMFIEKIISYEKAKLDIDYSYVNNTLMTSAYMEPNNTDGYMAEMDSFRVKNLPSYAKYWYLFEHFNCPENDHEKETYDTRYGMELSKENFISTLSYGSPQGFPHFILHKDHSNTQVFGIASQNKGTNLESKDIVALPASPYYNIIVTNSCVVANFSSDCVAEDFLNKNTIAFFGDTDIGYRDEYPVFNTFLSTLYPKGQKHIPQQFSTGYAHLQMLMNGINTTYHRFHLLGDPEMPIWTDTPKDLRISVSPQRITATQSEITVQIHNLPKEEEALVCLTDMLDSYYTTMICDTMPHIFHVIPRKSQRFSITVTAHNYRPFTATIPVSTSNDNLLSINKISNFDGIAYSGQKMDLNIDIRNRGTSKAENVKATLSSNSPYIEFLNETVDYGTIQPNKTYCPLTERFSFKVSENAPTVARNDLDGVRFYLTITRDNSNVHSLDSFSVDIFRPQYKIVQQYIVNTTDGDLKPEAGEDVYVKTEYKK